jgi:hypothetical protein
MKQLGVTSADQGGAKRRGGTLYLIEIKDTPNARAK